MTQIVVNTTSLLFLSHPENASQGKVPHATVNEQPFSISTCYALDQASAPPELGAAGESEPAPC